MSRIDVIGGELFIKKDWDKILGRLVAYGMSPSFISTKVPVTEEIVWKLVETKYSEVVQISLDSLDEDVLKKLIHCPNGYLERLLDGIELLQKYNFKIQFDTILTNINASESGLLALYNYVRKVKGLVYWEIRIPEMSIYRRERYKKVVYDKEELKNICTFAKQIREKSDIKIIKIIVSDEVLSAAHYETKPEEACFSHGICGILQNQMFILPDGKVGVCEQLYWKPEYLIGDLRTQTIEEIWNSPRVKAIFNIRYGSDPTSNCHRCKLVESCSKNHRRCPVRVIKAYGEEHWDYPDPHCTHAPKSLSAEYVL